MAMANRRGVDGVGAVDGTPSRAAHLQRRNSSHSSQRPRRVGDGLRGGGACPQRIAENNLLDRPLRAPVCAPLCGRAAVGRSISVLRWRHGGHRLLLLLVEGLR